MQRQAVDASGAPVFDTGALGAVHVFVHRCVDRGELALAARALRRFLSDRPADDAASVHLHWHLLVLEVDLGHRERASARFSEHVLPFIGAGLARTDGPSALWHLALAGARALPWEPAAQVARAHLYERDPFVAVHDALALAGAGATDALDEWIDHRVLQEGSALLRVGRALRARAGGDLDRAAHILAGPRLDLDGIGGSRAQRTLFERIVRGHLAMHELNDSAQPPAGASKLQPRGRSAPPTGSTSPSIAWATRP